MQRKESQHMLSEEFLTSKASETSSFKDRNLVLILDNILSKSFLQ